MRATVKKWGNSAAVRIPAGVMQASGLALDDAVDIREEGGCIVIEPMRPAAVELKKLLQAITPENQHAAIDFGPPAGRELL